VSRKIQSTAAGSQWADLTGATPGNKDVFAQLDYMCYSKTGADSCDTSAHFSNSLNVASQYLRGRPYVIGRGSTDSERRGYVYERRQPVHLYVEQHGRVLLGFIQLRVGFGPRHRRPRVACCTACRLRQSLGNRQADSQITWAVCPNLSQHPLIEN
jgi:hypothetical protein